MNQLPFRVIGSFPVPPDAVSRRRYTSLSGFGKGRKSHTQIHKSPSSNYSIGAVGFSLRIDRSASTSNLKVTKITEHESNG